MKNKLLVLATTVAMLSSTSAFAVVVRPLEAPAAGNWNKPAVATSAKETAKPAAAKAKHAAKKAKAKADAKTTAKTTK